MKNDSSNKAIQPKENYTAIKCRHDSLGRIFGGIIIIWLGISFLLMEHDFFRHTAWWGYFLLGLGIIFLIEAFIRMSRSEYSGRYTAKLIAGAILVAIGAGSICNLEEWWPLILIAGGIIIIILSLHHKET